MATSGGTQDVYLALSSGVTSGLGGPNGRPGMKPSCMPGKEPTQCTNATSLFKRQNPTSIPLPSVWASPPGEGHSTFNINLTCILKLTLASVFPFLVSGFTFHHILQPASCYSDCIWILPTSNIEIHFPYSNCYALFHWLNISRFFPLRISSVSGSMDLFQAIFLITNYAARVILVQFRWVRDISCFCRVYTV